MNDFKSKLPNFKELGEMSRKLFNDVSKSVQEIIQDYKTKHPSTPEPKTHETQVHDDVVETNKPTPKSKKDPENKG